MNDASHHECIFWFKTDFALGRAFNEIDFIPEYQLTTKLSLGFVDYFAINDSTGAKHGASDMNRALIGKK